MGFNRVTRGAGLLGAITFNSGITDRREVIPLTSAQILAMFATPQDILAAPGAGKAILVAEILFVFTAATQYANGGVVTFQYAGGAVVHASSIPAATLTSASSSNTALAPNSQASGYVVPG